MQYEPQSVLEEALILCVVNQRNLLVSCDLGTTLYPPVSFAGETRVAIERCGPFLSHIEQALSQKGQIVFGLYSAEVGGWWKPLPAALFDRFSLSITATSTEVEELLWFGRMRALGPTSAEMPALQRARAAIAHKCGPALIDTIERVAQSTRYPTKRFPDLGFSIGDKLTVGLSHRFGADLLTLATTRALLRGRAEIAVEDLLWVLPRAAVHRLHPTAEALEEGFECTAAADRLAQACVDEFFASAP
jgi:hypothetical protein